MREKRSEKESRRKPHSPPTARKVRDHAENERSSPPRATPGRARGARKAHDPRVPRRGVAAAPTSTGRARRKASARARWRRQCEERPPSRRARRRSSAEIFRRPSARRASAAPRRSRSAGHSPVRRSRAAAWSDVDFLDQKGDAQMIRESAIEEGVLRTMFSASRTASAETPSARPRAVA